MVGGPNLPVFISLVPVLAPLSCRFEKYENFPNALESLSDFNSDCTRGSRSGLYGQALEHLFSFNIPTVVIYNEQDNRHTRQCLPQCSSAR